MQNWIERLTDLAAIPGDEHMVTQALEMVSEATGFGGYAYLNIQPSHSSAVSNYHPEWQAEYFRRRFNKLDPVIKRAQALKRAFVWSGEWDRSRLSPGEQSFFSLAADFGIRSGITVPVRIAHGALAVFTLASSKQRMDIDREIDPVAAATAVAQLHTRIQFSDPTPSAEEPLKLDLKGATYLSWIANGKTMEEVADLEGVKYNSVRVKIEHARKQFNVHTIAHLTAIAIRRKLI
ncbi:LuxR family transcriptional activator of conjugal transfer of Ti plasmids [Rhizobium mesoamericanum]|uniref:autoinducer-binding transcriptional regulator TraR n=1 Tax=Rhizobium mesoamericanum TaxID=1079800 RepID=UPI00277E9952|nr:transcriptional regulator TraR [Rhizobium mesoamericanum]MDQ0563052.1 LuxR family transcriptional activator of conjugal transfer of Ti plasmids [Rhizobium mesoamericanum]